MPSVTSWTRLEPRCRNAEMGLSSAARVFDPLWLLARQWQLGEYQGEDRGSPACVQLVARSAMLSRCHLGLVSTHVSEQATPYDPLAAPLEVLVERQQVRPPAAAEAAGAERLVLAVEAGLHFLRMLEQLPGLGAYRAAFVARYALLAPADGADGTDGTPALDAETRAFTAMMVGRAPDARRLEAAFRSTLAVDAALGIATADRAAVEQCAMAWLAWYARLFSEPAPDAPSAWQPERLEYAVSVAAQFQADGSEEVALGASVGVDGRLDWSDFDIDTDIHLGSDTAAAPTTLKLSMVPAPVTFRGAPALRFWEFEDARVSHGLVPLGPVDLAQTLLIEYAGSYGNDWFVIPVELPVGSLTQVQSLVVSDSFGVRSRHRPAGDPSLGPCDWRMFQLSHTAASVQGPASNLFFLAPTLGSRLDGAALEEVLFLRDEMANIAWAVENVIESPVERPLARDDTRPPPAGPAPGTAPSHGTPVYDLSADVPEHWLPLLPVQLPQPDGTLVQRLQRGAVLVADGTPQLRSARGRILGSGGTLLLHDEEVPREGVRVTRHHTLARWLDGSTHLWSGLRSQVGRGEGRSGLAFDQLRTPEDIALRSTG